MHEALEDSVVGYRQVTDAWLVSLAHEYGVRLATFDRGIVELAGDRADELGVDSVRAQWILLAIELWAT